MSAEWQSARSHTCSAVTASIHTLTPDHILTPQVTALACCMHDLRAILQPAKSQAPANSANTVYDVKRIIGRRWEALLVALALHASRCALALSSRLTLTPARAPQVRSICVCQQQRMRGRCALDSALCPRPVCSATAASAARPRSADECAAAVRACTA
jgi:Hsp70 protein